MPYCSFPHHIIGLCIVLVFMYCIHVLFCSTSHYWSFAEALVGRSVDCIRYCAAQNIAQYPSIHIFLNIISIIIFIVLHIVQLIMLTTVHSKFLLLILILKIDKNINIDYHKYYITFFAAFHSQLLLVNSKFLSFYISITLLLISQLVFQQFQQRTFRCSLFGNLSPFFSEPQTDMDLVKVG